MSKSKLSWQGIAISSNPFQKVDPLSIHLLANLREASQFSDRHRLVVADVPQVTNYISLYGINPNKARKIVLRKGLKKREDLEKICRADGLSNIEVVDWKTASEGHRETFNQIFGIYETFPVIREAVINLVPERLRTKTEDLDLIGRYVLEEIAAILSFEGVKFGHEGEIKYDKLATKIFAEFGIGSKPEFYYSKVGLEYVPSTGYKVEPYSSLVDPNRLLLTDSSREFARKMRSLSPKSRRKLEKVWGMVEQDIAFYDRVARPSYNSLTRPARITRRVAIVAATLILSTLGLGAYVHHDANNIRSMKLAEISPFGLNGDIDTCRVAYRDKIVEVNSIIEAKYGVLNYF